MFKKVFSKILDINQKEIQKLQKYSDKVNEYEQSISKLKDADFAKRTDSLKKRINDGESLENILPEAFALVREASKRTIGIRHYDVQIMAAAALFKGMVAEQKTGEGKTASSIPALYLRALSGNGVHLVTVNDYLARRDAGWNAPVFELLGMSVGVIVQQNKSYVYDSEFIDKTHDDERLHHLKPASRKEAYDKDITYGTNNEFGFDYLRDNMVQDISLKVQRGHYYAIVDEVDSVLIDEARTPLIISAPDMEPTEKYVTFAKLVEKLDPEKDFTVDEKLRAATLTEEGISHVEKLMEVDNLYERDYQTIHHVENSLKAKTLYVLDRDYVVKDGEVIIVDEFTGRLMPGRRWSDGMHQAVEAKEGVKIQQESKTHATISFQNYFRMYEHLSGMTGTAATEAEEFKKIYDLDVVVLPTNKPVMRKDYSDVIYKSLRGKLNALADEIAERSMNGQPVLVGTTSIEKNEMISTLLRKKKIKHNVLNAKNHEQEATIIAEAGNPGAVTVATNMAGRGVDIVLGGAMPDRKSGESIEKYHSTKEYLKWKKNHETVLNSGGLHVIGTERHESRRIDNQLRGRSGRQGDPGSTRFYLSLEDDLMRIFGGEQMSALMDRLRLPEDQPIENKLISRAIEQAQIKVEGLHFDSRKNVVEYDDVANQQREIVYKLRDKILTSDDVKVDVLEKLKSQAEYLVRTISQSDDDESEDSRIVIEFSEIIPFDETTRDTIKDQLGNCSTVDDKVNLLKKIVQDVHASREKQVGSESMRKIEKFSYLSAIDHLWIEHIDYIDGLREGVRLRTFAQRDPKAEFKNEAYSAFEGLMDRIDQELSKRVYRTQVRQQPKPLIPLEHMKTNIDNKDMTGLSGNTDAVAISGAPAFPSRTGTSSPRIQRAMSQNISTSKLGRNDPCPCGAVNPKTGKPYKYKKCGLIGAPYHNG